jgi:hypothetical protein
MRVLSRIRQSRMRIAATGFAAVLTLFAAGIAVTSAASASTANLRVQPASQSAGTAISDETIGPFNGGTYGSLGDCEAALQALKQDPGYAGGACVPAGGGKYTAIYYIYVGSCGPMAPVGTITGRLAAIPDC